MFQTDQTIVMGLLGESGTGKTHLIHSYLTNSLPEKLTSTIAVQFATGFYKMQDQTKLKLKIWDTSGQDKYKQIVCYHLKPCQAIILVYDITNQKSFSKIDQWLLKLQKQDLDKQNHIMVLVGNKNDLESSRIVGSCKAESKAKEIGALFYQVNCFNRQQLKQAFDQIVQTIIEKKAEQQINKKQKMQQQKYSAQIIQRQQQLALGIKDSGAADSICSNCQIY